VSRHAPGTENVRSPPRLSHPLDDRKRLPSLAGVAAIAPGLLAAGGGVAGSSGWPVTSDAASLQAGALVDGTPKPGSDSGFDRASAVACGYGVDGVDCGYAADGGGSDGPGTADSPLAGVIALRRAGLCMRIVALARTGHRGTGVPDASGARYIAQAHARGAAAGDGVPRSTAPSRRADGAAQPSTMRIIQTAIRPTSGTVIGTP
jgi:hypothetical protein